MFRNPAATQVSVARWVAFTFSFPHAARIVVYKYLRDAVILTVIRREANEKIFQVLKTWKV